MDKPLKVNLKTPNPGPGHRLVISMRFGYATPEGIKKFHDTYEEAFEVTCYS